MNGNNGNVNNEREALIVKNMNVAKIVAAQYKNPGVEMEDLVGYANIGLVEAANRYRAEMGVSFRSYASWWCRKEVLLGLEEWGCREAPLPLDRVVGAEEEEPLTFGDMVPDPDEDVELRIERKVRIEWGLKRLPPAQREVVEGLLVGCTYEEIASVTGRSMKAVYSLRDRAMEKIKKMTPPARKIPKKTVYE